MALYSMGSVGTWAKMPQPPSNLKDLNYELPSLSTSLPSSFKTSLPSLPSSLPRSKVLEEAMADAVAMKRSATKAASAASAFASKLRTNTSTGQRYHAVAEEEGAVVYGQLVGHGGHGGHGDYLEDLDDPSRDDVSYSYSVSAPSNPPARKELFSDLSPRGLDASERTRSASSGIGGHATTGGNKDESPRQPAAPRSWAPAEKHGWDASRYAGVRPLQCSSIWDIPTSRFPEPERLSPAATRTTPSSNKKVPPFSTESRLPTPMVNGQTVRAISGGAPAWRAEDDAGCLRGSHRLALLVVLIFLLALAWR